MPFEQNAVETHMAVYSIKSALKNLSALRLSSARTLPFDHIAHASMSFGGRGGAGCDYGGIKNYYNPFISATSRCAGDF